MNFTLTAELCFSYATDMVTEAVHHIEISLCQSPLAKRIVGSSSGMRAGCLLICGASGIGKTTFSNALCHFAASAPRYAHIQIISCKRLCGR
jgi:ABC-type dipeptide/oligopeptide/nickel transport system ATPase subunit